MGRVRDDSTCWSMKCEVRVLEAKNVVLKHPSELFVRCYLSSGTGAKVPINTQNISSESDELHWGECFSLECLGDDKLINTLRQEKVIFELRRKSRTSSFFKRGSTLIGKVEVLWKTVLESADMKMEQWLPLVLKGDDPTSEELKPPRILVEMNIQAVAATMKDNGTEQLNRDSRRVRNRNECGCKHGGCCCTNDQLLLVLGASMFEAL